MVSVPTAGQVAQVLSLLEWEGRRKSSVVAVQGILWDATVLCGEPRPVDGTWMNTGTTVPSEVLLFALRVLAEIRAWAVLLEYERSLPTDLRALPDVVRLREQAQERA